MWVSEKFIDEILFKLVNFNEKKFSNPNRFFSRTDGYFTSLEDVWSMIVFFSRESLILFDEKKEFLFHCLFNENWVNKREEDVKHWKKLIWLINQDFLLSINLFSLSKQILPLIRFNKTFEKIFLFKTKQRNFRLNDQNSHFRRRSFRIITTKGLPPPP
jgi:hypothetical protein